MSGHGGSRHIKRMAVPSLISHQRKAATFVQKPSPGRHALGESLALSTLLRDVLGLVEDTRQARKLLVEGKIIVDGKVARSPKLCVGLMDVIEIPSLNARYRLVVSGGKLKPLPVSKDEGHVKLCKVTGKAAVAQGKVQLNLHDGRSQLIEREEDRFTPGDTIKLSVPKQKIEGFIKLERGARCYVYRGRHAGAVATLQDLVERAGSKEADARLKMDDGQELITVKSYLFAVDKEFRLNVAQS